MGAVALPRPLPAAAGPVARPELARLAAFVPLALFGGLQWGALITPARGGDIVLMLLAAVAGAGILLAVPSGAPPWRRFGVCAAVAVALVALALLTATVPLRLLVPDRWDELVSGIGQGIGSTPGITVPYRGVDDWVITAILGGGTALIGLAALLAFWPRRGARRGYPMAAAVALGALYAIPIIQHGPEHKWLSGAVFCVLMAGFLWLERLRADQVGIGLACVLVAVVVGAAFAPRLDARRPWFDYESFAEELQPTKAEAFTWDHRYGPLNWPRDGREMLRIKARSAAYWKVANLSFFDGQRWRQGPASREAPPDRPRPQWVQTIKVVDRGLRSHEFVGAGETLLIRRGASRDALGTAEGTFVTAGAPLKPGDSYEALVYTPNPRDALLRRVLPDYPAAVNDALQADLPLRGRSATIQDPIRQLPLGADATVRFAPYHSGRKASIVWPSTGLGAGLGDQVVRDSPYAQLYALAQRMAAAAKSPYDFALAVRDRVQQTGVYDESPPQVPYPLASFMFKEKRGYCQQFSGVMALMLRMGGVPARVSSGFSPGAYNSDRKEYVVKDTDAHSWVEAYFPRYGWITFDPTPAASPARSQTDDVSGGATAGRLPGNPLASLGQSGDRPFATGDPRTRLAPVDGGGGWKLPVALGIVALVLALVAFHLWRRRVPFKPLAPELAELQRALHRSGRRPSPNVTLSKLEVLLGGSDAASAYVRAVRDQRFRGGGAGPSAAQRRALRHQLGAGLGLRGRLNSWWALPPRLRLRRS
jgi:transglutaminase-like putative cysteine protease